MMFFSFFSNKQGSNSNYFVKSIVKEECSPLNMIAATLFKMNNKSSVSIVFCFLKVNIILPAFVIPSFLFIKLLIFFLTRSNLQESLIILSLLPPFFLHSFILFTCLLLPPHRNARVFSWWKSHNKEQTAW